ncbi:MAG: PDZ domain-containing protein [Acidobacteria bacterium]|nr:PDZ domain-containing protein [Acidobacteriota bacterium]
MAGSVLALGLCVAAYADGESDKPGYLGFGFEVDPNSGLLTVLYVVPGTPAETAGIRESDVLKMVSGAEVRFASHREALDSLGSKVREGVPVEFAFQRGGRLRSMVVVPTEPPLGLAARNEALLRCSDSALPDRRRDLPP